MGEGVGQSENLRSIFVISPIGKVGEDGADWTQIVLNHIVLPAVADVPEYSPPVRADFVAEPGPITATIVQGIVNSDVCIADLTDRNPNVMYEVAIAHAADKPVILLQQEAGGPPFDFAPERVIHYSLRVDEAEHARDRLAAFLRGIVSGERAEIRAMNPVRAAFAELKSRESASDPQRVLLGRLDAIDRQLRDITPPRPAGSGAFLVPVSMSEDVAVIASYATLTGKDDIASRIKRVFYTLAQRGDKLLLQQLEDTAATAALAMKPDLVGRLNMSSASEQLEIADSRFRAAGISSGILA